MKRAVSAGTAVSVCCVACLLVTGVAHAQDTCTFVHGGTLAMMSEDSSITMARCTVNVDVYARHSFVRSQFVLHNAGRAQTVTVGLPAYGGGSEGHHDVKAPPLMDFRMRVDGRTVRTYALYVHGYGAIAATGKAGMRWYLRRVHFRRGQTRIVHVTYRQHNAADSAGNRWVFYKRTPAASWSGSIGDLMVTYRWRENYAWRDPRCGWNFVPWVSADGTRLSWTKRNAESDCAGDLNFHADRSVRVAGSDQNYRVRLTEHGVEMQVWALPSLLGHPRATKTFEANTKTARLEMPDGLAIQLQAGSTKARVGDTDIVLPSPPYIEQEERRWGAHMWCVVDPILKELGYSVVIDRSSKRVEITPP